YELRVRALDNNGNFGTDVVTDFVVDCEGIVIGSTQFNQRGLLSPINDRGRVQSFTDTDLYMAIAIAGGPDKVEVHAEKEDTDQVFELTYNSQLELWEGNLFFADPGVYNLRVLATEASGQATSRYTNSVEVISGARVLDVDAGVVAGADVWVYYRPDQNSNWRLWNGGVFGVHQPLDSTQVEVVLEPGQYYLQIEHPDYFTTTTREFTVSEYSILNSQLRLYRKGDVLNWLNSISQPVTVMPITEQLITGLQSMIGERLPEISISGKTRTLNTDDLLAENKPFVLVTWTDWGTISAAQWQNISDLFTEENARLLGESSVYPVGLLEGEEEDSGVKARGDYEFPVYKPVDLGFYDILHIISAPQYFFVDAHGIVKDIRVGTMKIGEVSNILKEINTLPEVAESN
ncbi:hypothetical protein KC640_01885, partial [Candidatus Dojkabacteria bacterium]|nr:hypothetical protein [Candidatus Dojkabacteria bacterium]